MAGLQPRDAVEALQRHGGFQQGYVDTLAAGGAALARHECGRRAAVGEHARCHVDGRDAEANRRPVRLPGERHEPRIRRDHGVVARFAGQLAVGAVAGDGDVDEVGIDVVDAFPVDAERRGDLGQEALDQHVGVSDQPVEHGTRLGRLEVQDDVAFAAIDRAEIGAFAVAQDHWEIAVLVAVRRLDLDHVRAVVRKQLAAVGTCKDATDVHHFQSVEGAHDLKSFSVV